MSYPDEWEEQVERMAADLAQHRPSSLPESIRLLNRAAAISLARNPPPTIFADLILRQRSLLRRAWGESLWTARDVAPLV